jgi:hypothetical protein
MFNPDPKPGSWGQKSTGSGSTTLIFLIVDGRMWGSGSVPLIMTNLYRIRILEAINLGIRMLIQITAIQENKIFIIAQGEPQTDLRGPEPDEQGGRQL